MYTYFFQAVVEGGDSFQICNVAVEDILKK
jgi:hypothetical protein